MSNTNTSNIIYNKLIDRVFYPILLYIPKDFGEIFKNDKKLGVFAKLVGFILAVENEEYNFIADKNSNLLFIMGKMRLLESNIFDLIDAKQSLKKEQFKFLLNKYKTYLAGWAYITKVLDKDVASTDDALLLKYKGYITYQATMLQQHQNNLEKQFVEYKKTEYDFDLKAVILDRIKQSNSKVTSNQQNGNKKIRIKKQPLISNQDADDYLLKSVFRVNI
jgi:hypothetical protein